MYNGGWSGGDGRNYFDLAKQVFTASSTGGLTQDVSIPVKQAYDIDSKIDDGLPQGGKVMAMTGNPVNTGVVWAASGNLDANYGQMNSGIQSDVVNPGGPVSAGDSAKASASDTTCFDNGNVAGATASYSIGWRNGAMPNCALSLQFQ